MTDSYFARRHELRKRLHALLEEYEERTGGPSSDDPDLVVKVRTYLSQQQAKRKAFKVIPRMGRKGEK
jgi:hypothetical protein